MPPVLQGNTPPALQGDRPSVLQGDTPSVLQGDMPPVLQASLQNTSWTPGLIGYSHPGFRHTGIAQLWASLYGEVQRLLPVLTTPNRCCLMSD